ncbi:uncharacterized protein [Nicotiana tomentosiformis]|uniref:uncharacterized protein n=1 Tax=Nicotiana tomentosiformis TaxID=4098 RepID=UPI00388CA90B
MEQGGSNKAQSAGNFSGTFGGGGGGGRLVFKGGSSGPSLSFAQSSVYRDCIIMVHGRNTMDDLIELGMVDFDVIMGMDWLYSCFAKLDCRTRIVSFEFPNEPIIEWKGDDVVPKDRGTKFTANFWKNFQLGLGNQVVRDPSLIVPVETIEVNEELVYEEIPVAILDRQVWKLRNKEIASVKVLWQNQQVEEATWEAEEEMKKKYPHLFE